VFDIDKIQVVNQTLDISANIM